MSYLFKYGLKKLKNMKKFITLTEVDLRSSYLRRIMFIHVV